MSAISDVVGARGLKRKAKDYGTRLTDVYYHAGGWLLLIHKLMD